MKKYLKNNMYVYILMGVLLLILVFFWQSIVLFSNITTLAALIYK